MYYRKKLSETISRQELMTMNGKNGAVCAFIYYLVTMFGKEARDGILIDLKITNDDIAVSVEFLQDIAWIVFCVA